MTEDNQFLADDGSKADESVQVSSQIPSMEQPNKPSFWARLFDPEVKRAQLQANLDELSAAIARSPEVGVNYVLRGELYLKLKHYEHAIADFREALQIVIHEVEGNDWAFVAQVLQDRAQRGLEQASRKLNHRLVEFNVGKVEHQQSEVEAPQELEAESRPEEVVEEETT